MSVSASEILQGELTRLNAKKTNIDTAMAAQGRLMTLNDSYRKRYSKYTQIVAIFVFGVIAFLIVNAIPQLMPFIPKIFVDVLTLLVIVIVLYKILSLYAEINSRSNIEYDELDLPPNVDASMNNMSIDVGQNEETEFDMEALYAYLAQQGVSTCFGAQCCPTGYKYDTDENKCVLITTSADITAGAINTPTVSPFTTIEGAYSADDNGGFPKTELGSPAPSGQSFSTVGENYVEERFRVRPLE